MSDMTDRHDEADEAQVTHLLERDKAERDAMFDRLGAGGTLALAADWTQQARPAQIAPEGDWRIWMLMAGRGFGKTRAGAEWVRGIAEGDGRARIALIGASPAEARAVMVEGESGLLSIAPDWNRPMWHPALRRLEWRSGAVAFVQGASDPEALRGPQFSHAWADEIGKWPLGMAAWSNLELALRLGAHPRVVATTTPRPVPLVRAILGRVGADAVLTRGATRENGANLPVAYPPDPQHPPRRHRHGETHRIAERGDARLPLLDLSVLDFARTGSNRTEGVCVRAEARRRWFFGQSLRGSALDLPSPLRRQGSRCLLVWDKKGSWMPAFAGMTGVKDILAAQPLSKFR